MSEFLMLQGTLVLRIGLSALFGALIGAERQHRMKNAGVRTHLMVSLAAALMMIISKYGFSDIMGQAGYTVDVSRVAASIITGMGILGGGLIFISKQGKVSGITTAAGVWVTVGIGMGIGAGMYIISIVTLLLVLLCQHLLHKNWIFKESMRGQVQLYIKRSDDLKELEENLVKLGVELGHFKFQKVRDNKALVKTVLYFPPKYTRYDIIQVLQDIPEIESFSF